MGPMTSRLCIFRARSILSGFVVLYLQLQADVPNLFLLTSNFLFLLTSNLNKVQFARQLKLAAIFPTSQVFCFVRKLALGELDADVSNLFAGSRCPADRLV